MHPYRPEPEMTHEDWCSMYGPMSAGHECTCLDEVAHTCPESDPGPDDITSSNSCKACKPYRLSSTAATRKDWRKNNALWVLSRPWAWLVWWYAILTARFHVRLTGERPADNSLSELAMRLKYKDFT